MSRYWMQRCLFDHLRELEKIDNDRPADKVETDGYELTDAERTALDRADVGALYELGVHPVLINAFCRQMGWKRADYAVLFPEGEAERMRHNQEVRWLTS
ncbi:hypothetical protein [Propioniferax innocua]|uniref:Aromatic-ring opening dioxygenase LigAB LigA subunit n=1 Tax=Propioniferax innocua TaxID=1753 RepID=A0A542ZCA1_9ACTN|nr:hypothetical protein [Propioniferax innocua]TQL57983.1 hypothetical protein FB460_1833 [Propioniferax innocua]